ncbi:MAG: D-3-phosphoglycerate dehydrogenase [Myxococcota bacterium]|jgi:D-3-phosphoglycerate dehydrogenase
MVRIFTGPFTRGLVVEAPHASLDGELAQRGVTVTRLDRVPDAAALVDALHQSRAHVLFKRSRVPVTREVIEACPDLYAIQLCCIGDDSVDKQAAADHGLLVFNDPVSNGRSVVELAIGHLIALSRRLYETNEQMHNSAWEKSATGRYEIAGKWLGVLGLGNIGRQVARRCEKLGMRIRFFDNRLVAQEVGEEFGWERCATPLELFQKSDAVTVHTSARDALGQDNAGMLDSVLAELGADRPSESPRIYLNLARGNLHGSESLLAAVASGAIRRAAVDVYPEEPAPGATSWVNPYASQPAIVCTPHVGAATQEAQPRIARRVAATIGAFSATGAMRDCVFNARARLGGTVPDAARAALAVVHSVRRGTKKAVDDAIYEAGASNLGSAHRDFAIGAAYDLSFLDRPLERAELDDIVTRAVALSGDPSAIRTIRQITLR